MMTFPLNEELAAPVIGLPCGPLLDGQQASGIFIAIGSPLLELEPEALKSAIVEYERVATKLKQYVFIKQGVADFESGYFRVDERGDYDYWLRLTDDMESNPYIDEKLIVSVKSLLSYVECKIFGNKTKRRISTGLKEAIIARDGYRCRYCGKDIDKYQIDHVVPYSRGGLTEYDNLVIACVGCNAKKHDKTPNQAGMTLLPAPGV